MHKMLKEETSVLNIDINNLGRPYDTRHTAVYPVYRCAGSAYLCPESGHRYAESAQCLCQACEQAPAAFLCKADSASLCAACDTDVHSANPLARRHLRVPILPVVENGHESFFESIDEEDESEVASWLLFNPVKSSAMDEYIDLGDYSSTLENRFADQKYSGQEQQYTTYDSVVPIQNEIKNQVEHHDGYRLKMEYDKAKTGYGYPVSSSHCVSVPSIDVGLVPESSTSDMSISHPRPPKGVIDLFSNPPIQMPTQLSPMDRKARVLRYREKKKIRKFEKTIRYASRKAYAETRPRIKGRFAKRTEVDVEVDQMFSTSVFTEDGYGIVPSY